jgi:DNA polymerase
VAVATELALPELDRLTAVWAGCGDCRLAESRTTVVVGVGSPTADVMFAGEAPGFHEDRQGVPFVGQAGALLDGLLAGIGLGRADVYIANVLKCRPPGNRDPLDDEIAACEGKLVRQVELVAPRVVCTLGNFATKLLSGRPHGITRVHGQARRRRVGEHDTVLFPLYHPAAALHNPRLRPELEADMGRLPELLRHLGGDAEAEPARPPAAETSVPATDVQQLGLF